MSTLNLRRLFQFQTGRALVRNTAWMLGGSSVHLMLQAAYFILMARALGPSQYGAFVGSVALIGIVSPFAGLGFGGILIKHTARDRNRFSECWGNAISMIAFGGSVLLALLLATKHFIVGDNLPTELIVFVAAADLFCFPVVTLAGQAFVAFEKLKGTATTLVILSSLRMCGAILVATQIVPANAISWGKIYFISSAVAAGWAFIVTSRRLGRPRIAFSKLRPDFMEAIYFSIGGASQTVYNDIDKTMLVRFSLLSAAGIYGTAYRIVDVSFQPVSALLYSSFAKFFKAGEAGVKGTVQVARRLLPVSGLYGGTVAILLIAAAPLLTRVLGERYSESVVALRWLATLSFFRAIHYLAANSLTGAGFQGLRTAAQILVAGLNVGLNLLLIPRFSWRGAAWASLISDGLLAVALWLLCGFLVRSDRSSRSCQKNAPALSATPFE